MKPQTTNPCEEQAIVRLRRQHDPACSHDMVVLTTVWYPEVWISCATCGMSYPVPNTALGGI